MKVRVAAALAALCVAAACAPTPGGTPSPEPAETASISASPSETVTTETPSQTPTSTPSADVTGSPQPSVAPSASRSSSSPSAASGWTVLDVKVSNPSEVDALPVTREVAHYVKSRLGEPCELQMTLFAAHSDGYLVADETGICDGNALFVYGPHDGEIAELVEFTQIPSCGAFESAGVPNGVPTSKLFPDGLACSTGAGTERY